MSAQGWAQLPTSGREPERGIFQKSCTSSHSPSTAASASPHTGLALPAKAIRTRLLAAAELPSWAAYLPERFSRLSAPPGGTGQPRQPDRARPPSAACASGSPAAGAGGGRAAQPAGPDGGGQAARGGARGAARGGRGVGLDGQEAGAEAAAQEQPAPDLTDCTPATVLGSVWALARDPQGCRQVQRALEVAGSDEARSAIAAELEGHVWEAMRCPHANHVLQKCIVAMRPKASQFIIDELTSTVSGTGGISQAARHRYGCRIVERLVEHCPPSQVSELIEKLVADAVALSRHPYGNYVMQHLLEHGPVIQRRKLIDLLQQNASTAGSDCYARAVISKALNHGAREDQVSLARALLQEPGLLTTMARTRHGHVAAKFVLLHLDGPDQEEARRQLTADLEVIRASRYGRFVVACLDAANASAAAGEPGML